jgi:hypothetical protein
MARGNSGSGARRRPGKPGGPSAQAPARRAQPSAQPTATADQLAATADQLAATADQLHESEQQRASEGGRSAETGPLPLPAGDLSDADLQTAIAKAIRAAELADARELEAAERLVELNAQQAAAKSELVDQLAALDRDRASLDSDRADLETRLAEVAADRQANAETAARLYEKERQLRELEQAAMSDFAAYRQEQLGRLGEELAAARAHAEEGMRAHEAMASQRRAEENHALDRKRDELGALESELITQRLELDRRERIIDARWEDLDQEVMIRTAEAGQRHAGEIDLLQHDLASWRERAATFQQLADQRKAELDRYETAAVETGHRPLPELADELADLKKANAQLRQELAGRPAELQGQVIELEARCQTLIIERQDLIRRMAELQRTADAGAISVAERQNAVETARAYQRLNTLLQEETEYLTAKLTGLQTGSAMTPPFPACSAMDDHEDYQEAPELQGGMPKLAAFVERVQHLIATDQELYYSDRHLRSFLGGLAASKLHLLEGISGIGKTRLPQAFAAVMGAECETVAVAAEWRSPADLLGYYNSFERKFYESPFTQALYRAQLPAFRDKPFFIVLDEMNLSHPEQYFNDLLSELEKADGPRMVRLMTAPVDPAPRLLVDGVHLLVPDNVWFIGTANNDETTVRFADKTYDRSYLLELPPRPSEFTPGEPVPLTPISMAALTRRFEEAKAEHPDAAAEVLKFLEGDLGDRLRMDLRVSWGSRLARQAAEYVPVVYAAGGSIGEAADHLLATKVLRKLKGRVDIKQSALKSLQELLAATWPWGQADLDESVTVLQDALATRGTLL